MTATARSTTTVRIPSGAARDSCAILLRNVPCNPPAHPLEPASDTGQRVTPAALSIVLFFSRGGQETGLGHQIAVQDFSLRDPRGEFLAGHEGLVEGAVFHEFLPFRRLAQALEEIDVVLHVLRLDGRRHEDA